MSSEDNALPNECRLPSAASKLHERWMEVIQRWEQMVRRDLEAASGLTKPLLHDSITDYLQQLSEALRAPRQDQRVQVVAKIAQAHGGQRASLDFDLNQVLHEYILLRKALFEVLERDGMVSRRERDIILDMIQLSIRESTAQFLRIQEHRHHSRILQRVSLPYGLRCLVSLGVVAVATALQLLLWAWIQPLVFLVFYPAVMVSAYFGSALVAILLSILSAQFFFIEPFFELKIGEASMWGHAVLFAVFSGCLSWFVHRSRGAIALAEEAGAEQARARREGEAAIQELQDERELRERFVTTISHDLRSPLAAARMSAEMMMRYPDRAEMRPQLLRRIMGSMERADRMIRDLLDVNRVRAGQPLSIELQHFDLEEVAREVFSEMELVHEGRRMEVRVSGDTRGLWGRDALRRVIENLLSNAVKYGDASQPICLDISSNRNEVEIRVHNQGTPIPAQDLVSLFELFQRSALPGHVRKQGWGIGLTLVRGLVEAQGGTVRATSSAGEGTNFIVRLPRESKSAA